MWQSLCGYTTTLRYLKRKSIFTYLFNKYVNTHYTSKTVLGASDTALKKSVIVLMEVYRGRKGRQTSKQKLIKTRHLYSKGLQIREDYNAVRITIVLWTKY